MSKVECERAQKLISLYLAGDLSKEEVAQLAEHTGACEKCRAAFEEAKRYEAALKGMLRKSVSKMRSPKSRVLRKIESEPRRRRRGKSVLNWFLFFLLMVVLCFLIIVTYVSYERMKQENLKKSRAAGAHLALVMEALQKYRADYGLFPAGSNREMVRALKANRRGRDVPYFAFKAADIADGLLVDPWKRAYVYRPIGEAALLYSVGPNGRDEDGLGDDLRP